MLAVVKKVDAAEAEALAALRERAAQDAGVPTAAGYRLFVVCGCGAEFKRWVTLDDADEDLLKSALLAFEN